MSSKKSIFKIIDAQGRIVIPQEFREKADMLKGDIIELKSVKNGILLSKLDVIKLNDDSIESLRNTVISSAKKLDQRSLLELAKKMVEMAEKTEEMK